MRRVGVVALLATLVACGGAGAGREGARTTEPGPTAPYDVATITPPTRW